MMKTTGWVSVLGFGVAVACSSEFSSECYETHTCTPPAAEGGEAGGGGESSVTGATGGTTGASGSNAQSGSVGMAGEGSTVLPDCADHVPGFTFCDGQTVKQCSEDGQSASSSGACENQACFEGACTGVCNPGSMRCTEGGSETCSELGQWQTAVICDGQACVDGACVGECVPGTRQCADGVPQTCSDAGAWVSADACAVLCSGGACSGTCTPGKKQCNGQVPQVCDGTGTWQDGNACEGKACDDATGTCVGVCAPQTKRCDPQGNGVQTCSDKGTWGAASNCVDQTCVGGACVGTCSQGEKQCSDDNGVETCTATGNWGTPEACANQACVAGACVGTCVPGTKKCGTGGVQTCTAMGAWSAATACPGQACVNGACSGSCSPGDKQCDGANGVQTCGANGSWSAGVKCSSKACVSGACVGSCEPGSKQCSGSAVESCSGSGTWSVVTTCVQPETCNNSSCSDVTAPSVVSITPANGSSGVASNAKIVVTFSEAMDHASTEAAFTQTGVGAVSFSWNGKVLSIVPNTALPYATGTTTNVAAKSFKVTMGTGAKDLAGNSLQAASSTTFTTLRKITTTFTKPVAGMWTVTNYNGGSTYHPDGDSSALIGDGFTNEANRVVMSFDLLAANIGLPAGLQSIESATLSAYVTVVNPIDASTSWGNAAANLGDLVVDHLYIGDISASLPISAMTFAPLSRAGVLVPKASASSGTKSLDVTSSVTDDFNQRAVRNGNSQYRIQFDKLTNSDGKLDLNAIKFGTSATLQVVYLIP